LSKETWVAPVNGAHYDAEIQHWDVMERWDIDYLVATATKYLLRWRKKGFPLIDLRKSRSFFEKARLTRIGGVQVRRTIPWLPLSEYMNANGVCGDERVIIVDVLGLGGPDCLARAVETMDWLITRAEKEGQQ
jgi:hypothetical protein